MATEKVAFVADPSHLDRFLPRVASTQNGETTLLPFQKQHVKRVLDFENVPDPPSDGTVMYCEDGGTEGLKFHVRHMCLRGGFLFYFDVGDVYDDEGNVEYLDEPLGVLPLNKVGIEFPPGGRRVFREHAHTDARNGYELVVYHAPDDGEETRPPAFLVLESLAQREKWAAALRARAEMNMETKLRQVFETRFQDNEEGAAPQRASQRGLVRQSAAFYQTPKKGDKGNRSTRLLELEGADDLDAQRATDEFGRSDFSEEEWVDSFFRNNRDYDAPTKCRLLENWQAGIKRGLKDSVLEQYEYFVDAAAEMAKMGREVAALKTMVETQNECIKEMKEIDFLAGFGDVLGGVAYDSDEEGMEPPHLRAGARRRRTATHVQDDDQSDASSLSSSGRGVEKNSTNRKEQEAFDPFGIENFIELPAWLEDTGEEISAFIKESRYTDATDLLLKAKAEVDELLAMHEKPTEGKLSKKIHASLVAIQGNLQNLTERMCSRLAEGLRRKNEALKQASKRERADPSNLMAPIVSPCCLDDDVVPLQLLVKLGEAKEAAAAFSARRSLLLTDSLHERPISGTGNVDLVIYAAQLSQSFFSDLANAVEGFLDLFLVASDSNQLDHPKDEASIDSASFMSSAVTRKVPSSALAAIVLWCDSELAKFSSAFGGTRILGNLVLSPPPRRNPKSKGRNKGNEDGQDAGRERKASIEVAAQCIDQAFQYASENLDLIGLPLAPRLAEYMRVRLKGCEGEIAGLLDERWRQITYDWENFEDDVPMDERRGMTVEDD